MVIAFLMMNPFHHKYYPNRPEHLDGGEYNGYVAFNRELPLSWQGGADYDNGDALDNLIDVHGGITFDSSMETLKDCPIIPLTEIPHPVFFEKFRVIGFDTLHYNDTKDIWTLEATKQETLRLKEQIEELLKQREDDRTEQEDPAGQIWTQKN